MHSEHTGKIAQSKIQSLDIQCKNLHSETAANIFQLGLPLVQAGGHDSNVAHSWFCLFTTGWWGRGRGGRVCLFPCGEVMGIGVEVIVSDFMFLVVLSVSCAWYPIPYHSGVSTVLKIQFANTQLCTAIGFSLWVCHPCLLHSGQWGRCDFNLFAISDALAAQPLLGGLLHLCHHLLTCAIKFLILVGTVGCHYLCKPNVSHTASWGSLSIVVGYL